MVDLQLTSPRHGVDYTWQESYAGRVLPGIKLSLKLHYAFIVATMRIEVATCKESAAANSKTASDDTCAQSVKARVYSSLTAENRSQESAHPAKVAIARLHSPSY